MVMPVKTITQPKLQSAVLKWFCDEDYCFEQETALANSGAGLATPGLFDIGLVVGKIGLGAATVTKTDIGNSRGAITVASPGCAAGAPAGDYEIIGLAAASNLGTFEVFRPDGTLDGIGTVGTAYTGTVKFTLADGSSDLAVGDVAKINVAYAAGSGKVVPLNLSAVDGSQNVAGVIARPATVPVSADAQVVAVVRLAVLLDTGMIYPSGASAGDIVAINAQLAALGILVRAG